MHHFIAKKYKDIYPTTSYRDTCYIVKDNLDVFLDMNNFSKFEKPSVKYRLIINKCSKELPILNMLKTIMLYNNKGNNEEL